MIRIRQSVIEGIIAHAIKDAPLEACGYCGGSNDNLDAFFPLTNLDASGEHFTMDPKEQFASLRAMRKKGLKLRAVYHSHPATPARPSQEDIRLAQDPDISYVIVSLIDGLSAVSSFLIKKGKVEREQIVIVADSPDDYTYDI